MSWGRACTVQHAGTWGGCCVHPEKLATGHQQGPYTPRLGANCMQMPRASLETDATGKTWNVNLTGSAVPGTWCALVPFCMELEGELSICTSAGEEPPSTAFPYSHPGIGVLQSSYMYPKASLPSCHHSQKPQSQSFSFQCVLAPPPRYLEKPRSSQVSSHIHHVDAGGDEAGEDQAVPLLGGIPKAAAAGVPPRVVQLVPQVGHGQAVDHLQSPSPAYTGLSPAKCRITGRPENSVHHRPCHRVRMPQASLTLQRGAMVRRGS